MTSGRVMKMLGLILLLVLWFLAAWTVGMLENIDKNIPLVIRSQTPRGLQFYICDHDRWDYMMVVGETLLSGLPMSQKRRCGDIFSLPMDACPGSHKVKEPQAPAKQGA